MAILKVSGFAMICFLLLFNICESFFDSDQVDPVSEKREIVIHGTVKVERPASHARPSKIVVLVKSGVNLLYGTRELAWKGATEYKYDVKFEIDKDTKEIKYRLGAHLKVMVDYGRDIGIGEDNGHHARSMHDIAEAFSRPQTLHIQASDPFEVQKNFEYSIDDRGGSIRIKDKLEPSVKKPEGHVVKKQEVVEHKPKQQVQEPKNHFPVAKENHEGHDKSPEHKHIEIHGTVHLKLPEGRVKPTNYYAIVRRKVGQKWADYATKMECSKSLCTYKISMFALPNEQYKVGAKREGKDVRRRKAISTRRNLPGHFPEEPYRIEVDFDYNLTEKNAFIKCKMSAISYVLLFLIFVETFDILEGLAPKHERLANQRKERDSHKEKCGGHVTKCTGPADCGATGKKDWACLQLKCHLFSKTRGKVSGAKCSKRCCPKANHHADLKAKGQPGK
ncbi:hypothetical protein DdX_17774 [Ditylenchus destructor]|uniref:Uncharacterized protein n=1 Tax=Ditylenchus destructor TaxID=166010 RepID=A0AAD4MKS7_9BILA|nr:hypothetical protein DdX_17774 [Ditylenchus destructor]